MRRGSRSFLWMLLSLGPIGCLDGPDDPGDEEISSESQDVEGCSGTGASVYQQVCGVGESNGKPAVNFRGQWFSLDYSTGNWTVANGVSAQAGAVAPVDTVPYDSRTACLAQCCPERRCPGDPPAGPFCRDLCNMQYTLDESRQFTWTVAGRTYTVAANQRTWNRRTRNGQVDVKYARLVVFKVTTNDPVDSNPWTIVLHPINHNVGAADQEQVNWEATEPAATTDTGHYNSLFSASEINVQVTPNVEIMSAVKTSAPGTTEMMARSNVAMNRALDDLLPQGSSVQNLFEPEAVNVTGNVLASVPGTEGDRSYDMQRFSQFYLNDRRGNQGFSLAGSGERPLAESKKREWRFRHNIIQYQISFPFLAGICGCEVFVNSYIAGALTFGHRSCFDGLPVDVDMAGSLEFALRAGGGFGCNIFVASASAGLYAGVRARSEFSVSVDAESLPPALTASVNLYAEAIYAAYFKMRVLFWKKKWEKEWSTSGGGVFQRGASVRLESSHALPAGQLCSPEGTPAETGTCSDPEASCDIEGRCIRYDFLPAPREPERTDVGECTLPTCTFDPPLPMDYVLDPFLPAAAACAPQCGDYPHGTDVNPNGTPCPGCDGLPPDFNRSLLSIPANAFVEILTSTESGQRARVYTWEAGGTRRAVFEVSGVTTGSNLANDAQDSLDSWRSPEERSPTAAAIEAKLTKLYNEGYSRQNVLIRAHSLGSLDAYRILERGVGAGNAILLGVPLHIIIRVNKEFWDRSRNPVPNTQMGIFVSPRDPVARGLPLEGIGAQYEDVWCKAKKGPGPGFNRTLPANIRFNVVDTPSQEGDYLSGHYIGSYCAVAAVTCFQGDALVRHTTVNLRANNGQYVVAENGGGGQVNANRNAAGPWEQFVIESIGPLRDGGHVYIRTSDNSHFFDWSNDAPWSFKVTADATNRTGHSSFTILRVAGPGEIRSGDGVALLSRNHGRYVSADDGGGGKLMINRTKIGPWETFQIIFR